MVKELRNNFIEKCVVLNSIVNRAVPAGEWKVPALHRENVKERIQRLNDRVRTNDYTLSPFIISGYSRLMLIVHKGGRSGAEAGRTFGQLFSQPGGRIKVLDDPDQRFEKNLERNGSTVTY